MKFPKPEDIGPAEFQLAVDKSREFFEKLTWDELRAQATVDSHEKALKIAKILYVAGEEVEKALGVTPEDWAKMLVMGGCAILSAIEYGKSEKKAKSRSDWN